MSNNVTEKADKTGEKQGLTPKRRFPEFRDAEGWTTETLGTLASISTEKVGDNTCIPMSISSGVGLVSQMEKFGRIIAGSSYKNYLLLKKNDFAYNKSATKEYPEGFIALYSGDELAAVPNSIFTCFRIKGDSPVPQYLNHLLFGNLHGQWLRKFIEVGARAHGSLSIDEDDLLALPVPLPKGKSSLAEQQKIADCLSSLDELTTAEAQKLDTLKAYKKGLMQQLFPSAGETLPKLRFPEFWDAEEWETFTLIQVAKFRRGSFPQPYGLPEWYDEENGMPFVQVFDVDDNLQLRPKTKNKISKLASEQSVFIPEGTVIITIQGSIGRVAITQYDAYIDRTLLLFEEFLKPMEKIFFAYVIQLLFEIERQKAPGEIIKTITKEVLSDFVIRLPHIEEQQKIADCLSSLDDLIAAQTQKLKLLKAYKKGLMQQLFPALDEVNG
jgi:type I restriction enzyme S subunit